MQHQERAALLPLDDWRGWAAEIGGHHHLLRPGRVEALVRDQIGDSLTPYAIRSIQGTTRPFFWGDRGSTTWVASCSMLRFRHLGAGDLLAPLLWLFPVPGVGKHRQERGKVGRLVGKPGLRKMGVIWFLQLPVEFPLLLGLAS